MTRSFKILKSRSAGHRVIYKPNSLPIFDCSFYPVVSSPSARTIAANNIMDFVPLVRPVSRALAQNHRKKANKLMLSHPYVRSSAPRNRLMLPRTAFHRKNKRTTRAFRPFCSLLKLQISSPRMCQIEPFPIDTFKNSLTLCFPVWLSKPRS